MTIRANVKTEHGEMSLFRTEDGWFTIWAQNNDGAKHMRLSSQAANNILAFLTATQTGPLPEIHTHVFDPEQVRDEMMKIQYNAKESNEH